MASKGDDRSAKSRLGSPLVKLPAPPVVTARTPKTVIDHPLAATEASATPKPAATAPLSLPIPLKRTGQTVSKPVTPVKSFVSPAHFVSMNVEDLADTFMAGDAEKGIESTLHPSPMPKSSSDLNRLRLLVRRRAWGDVCLLTERLLRGQNSHYAAIYKALLTNSMDESLPTLDTQQTELVEIMMIQCEAWVRMGRYAELGLEVERWGFCHHNDNNAPSWIPWKLHIMAALSLLFSSEDKIGSEALDALWKLREDIPTDDALSRLQVENALSNCFVRIKQWRMVLSCQERCLQYLPGACQKLVGSKMTPGDPRVDEVTVAMERAYRCEVYSFQGRVFLQLGAIAEAERVFKKISDEWATNPLSDDLVMAANDDVVTYTASSLAVSNALLNFSKGDHDEALESFQTAVGLIRTQKTVVYPSEPAANETRISLLPSSMGSTIDDSLYSEAMNNMAICSLYTCRLKEAIQLMESLIQESPTQFLTERVALNLCILYELSNESSVATKKKKVLQAIAKRFMLHDVTSSSFRL